MPKKVVILIDGQNLYYSLKSLNLIERDINWEKFLSYLLEPEDELIRTYWFRPAKLSEHKLNISIAKGIINKDNLNNDPIEFLKRAEDWYSEHLEKFKKQDRKYDRLKLDYNNIAIIKKGIIKVNPWKQYYLGEKGVDVSLVINMVRLKDKVDKFILITGDFDYSEAIEYVKEDLITVHLVCLFKGEPPKHTGMSKELTLYADKVIDVYESQLKTDFKK
ncbi:hypothetical protein ES705_42911 [subsurface metagenome]